MDKLQEIIAAWNGRRILILGFGKEGQSSLHYLDKVLKNTEICIADQNPNLQNNDNQFISSSNRLTWVGGPAYLETARNAEIILKSPGIPPWRLPSLHPEALLSSQAELFIQAYKSQIIGITGTKGKSTTASLLHHILLYCKKKSILAGNIGIPFFSILDEITHDSLIVCELSCHQLHRIKVAPRMAILLNIFQEHLDYYRDIEEYRQAKLNLAFRQTSGDILIYHDEDPILQERIAPQQLPQQCYTIGSQSNKSNACYITEGSIWINRNGRKSPILPVNKHGKLLGKHNLINIMAALMAADLLLCPHSGLRSAVESFNPLEHRLEDCGFAQGIHFYNDSISTIPEACIQALETLPEVHTLIIGGFDRGIDYQPLVNYLLQNQPAYIIFTGDAGKRVATALIDKGFELAKLREAFSYQEVVSLCMQLTPTGKTCLLSPAAASYDWFNNFEERGRTFKRLIPEHDAG